MKTIGKEISHILLSFVWKQFNNILSISHISKLSSKCLSKCFSYIFPPIIFVPNRIHSQIYKNTYTHTHTYVRSSDPCGDCRLRRRRRRTACITFFLLDTDNYLIPYPTEQQQRRSQSKIHARSRAYVSPAVIKLICIIKRRLLANLQTVSSRELLSVCIQMGTRVCVSACV